MSKQIKGLTFILENCESLFLDLSHKPYSHLSIGNCYISYFGQDGDLSEHIVSDYFYLKIDKKEFVNNIHYRNEFPNPKHTAWERFQLRDVTSICLVYEDDTELQIYIPCSDCFCSPNKYFHIKTCKPWIEDLFEIEVTKKYYWTNFKFNVHLFFVRKFPDFIWRITHPKKNKELKNYMEKERNGRRS